MAAKTIPISSGRTSVKANSETPKAATSEASAGKAERAASKSSSAKDERKPSQRDSAAQAKYSPRYETPSRRPAESRPTSFNPLAWVADGVTGAIEEARHNDLGLSQDFWKHLYAVRRESLLTAQALVESLIAKVESKADEQEQRAQQRQRRGSVDIDF